MIVKIQPELTKLVYIYIYSVGLRYLDGVAI